MDGQQMENTNEQIAIRRGKLLELQKNKQDPFMIVSFHQSHHSTEIKEHFEELEDHFVSVAGRIMTRRMMGKASFVTIQDREGQIQLYVKKDEIGESSYEDFKRYDIGDILGVEGIVFRTQKGEISVKATKISLLSKSLQILPEKWHGLKDQDLRYRQRYVDLIVNTDVKTVFLQRSKIIKSVRNTLDERGFIEVETPVLQPIAGGASARPFVTHHNTLDMELYLRIALELHLKRLIVGGLEKVYEIGRVFRNEGMSIKHNPEFTMLELYEAYSDYHQIMDLCEDIFRNACLSVLSKTTISYQGTSLDFGSPFRRITMIDAIKQYTGVDFLTIHSEEEAKQLAKSKGVAFEARHGKGDIINLFFENFVEEHLIQPTFVMDHPWEISPLTKRKPDNPELTERFELFIMGRECANAYSELNDPIDQRNRFLHQQSLRDQGDEEANQMDEDFLKALEYGMPPTGGLGIGIDRMVMILTDSPSIRDVLLFPTMKPEQ